LPALRIGVCRRFCILYKACEAGFRQQITGIFGSMGETAPPEQLSLRKTIVLIGMMGAGKTAIGKALAQTLGVELRDSDAEIVESAQLSIAEIFERYGEPFFREKEAQVISRLLAGPPCILSTGGGAWLSAENRARLTERACVLWLKADLDLLWQRVRHKTTRPLLRTSDPKATLTALLAERAPVYALAPSHVHVQPVWSIEETAGHVMDALIDAGAVERM
jgi:shikimate kinase